MLTRCLLCFCRSNGNNSQKQLTRIQHLLRASHEANSFAESSQPLLEVGSFITPIFEMRKLMDRQVRSLSESDSTLVVSGGVMLSALIRNAT